MTRNNMAATCVRTLPIHYLVFIQVFTQMVVSSQKPASMSVVVERGKGSGAKDFIQVTSLPKVLKQDEKITVEYSCSGQNIVGMETLVTTATREEVCVNRRTWTCDVNGASITKTLQIKLPSSLAYKPDSNNRKIMMPLTTFIRVWILSEKQYNRAKTKKTYFRHAAAKTTYSLAAAAPYERPPKPKDVCASWPTTVRGAMSPYYSPVCTIEPEVYHAISFPAVFNGGMYGVHRTLPEYSNKQLRRLRQEDLDKPTFTMVMWLYIVDYCPSGRPLCAIMQHMTWDDLYMTPVILLNQQGQVHFQVVTKEGKALAFLSTFSIPKDQWTRLTIQFNKQTLNMTLSHGEEWTRHDHTEIRLPPQDRVWYDDVYGLHVFGGTELTPSFKGYIGEASVYRRLSVPVSKLPMPNPYHPMFELGLSRRESKCSAYLSWVRHRIYQCKQLWKARQDKVTCHKYDKVNFFMKKTSASTIPQCNIWGGRTSRNYQLVSKLVRNRIMTQQNFKLEDIAKELHKNASARIDAEGLRGIKNIIQTLKQASCYGNHDATYFLTVILSGGIGVKAEENQAQSYLMYGALDANRLCLLALGNKHTYGLDGMPKDLEQAYVYHKNVADVTRQDQDLHSDKDVMLERVRLTDEKELEAQTDEDGDLFMWIKHQAAQGVATAQKQMGRMLFWGAQGLRRNLQAAVDYYRMGAEQEDPTSMYDYGIVLLRGQGTEKNMTAAREYLDKAADKGNPRALNALGWHALEIQKNYTMAADLLERAKKHGNPDAAHNLGHMYISGRYPNTPVDRVMAFRMFAWAAVKGQLDSAIMVALYNQRGHPEAPRNPEIALEWSRYVSDHNPALSMVLAKGLKAYRNMNWEVALLYYKLAADAGIEVGTFNLAYLCEQNPDGMISFLEKECVWRYYNLSTQRDPKLVDPYAWIKMGDYYWYGCERVRDVARAADLYANAAKAGDPQALFNLAFMVEDGQRAPQAVWDKLRIPRHISGDNVTLLTHLYSKCTESRKSEAYLPCKLALLRVQLTEVWVKHPFIVKLSSMLGVLVATSLTIMSMYSYIRGSGTNVNTI